MSHYKKLKDTWIVSSREGFETIFTRPMDKTVIIAGVCRNTAKYLKQVFNNLRHISSYFRDAKYIFYENDSTDNTLQLLYKLSPANSIIISEKNIDKKYRQRTDRLAYARNKIIKLIEKNNFDNIYDYLIIVDMDDILTKPILNFNSSFTFNNWDVMTLNNNLNHYYDRWALRNHKK